MPMEKGTYGSKKGRPKKSKRCGRGKLPDGKGGCRKMTLSELRYLKDKAVLGSIGPSMAGMKVGGPKAAAVAGVISGYVRGKQAKKKMSNYYRKKK
tara:strand:- start:457 stop:744 length:288 start_codon:yes stop_codon:yes gene_type:complete